MALSVSGAEAPSESYNDRKSSETMFEEQDTAFYGQQNWKLNPWYKCCSANKNLV